MRQTKSFFIKNNRLDKVGAVQKEQEKKPEEKLLDARTLADFEKISPGFNDKLLMLAKSEQDHSQKMDNIQSSIAKSAYRIGRLSFVFIFIAICYFTYSLILNNMVNEGLIFGALAFTSLITACVRSSGKTFAAKHDKNSDKTSRQNFRKPQHRRRNFKRKN